MVAVPYGHAEHGADVKVRELVCLKITLGRIQCTATIIFRLQKKKERKRKKKKRGSGRHQAAAGKRPLILVSGCVFWPRTHFPFVCHDDLQLTTSTFAARSLDVPPTAALAIVGLGLGEQSALRLNLRNQLKSCWDVRSDVSRESHFIRRNATSSYQEECFYSTGAFLH